MNILGGLQKFISDLPLFENKLLYIDYLENIKDSYTIERAGEVHEIRRYTDGGKLMEYDFFISSRKIYPDKYDEIQDFFSQLSSSVKKLSNDNILPDIGSNATAVEIRCISDIVRKSNDFNMARYSMKFKLVYYVN